MRLLVAVALLVPACVAEVDTQDEDIPVSFSPDAVHASITKISTISYAPNSFVIGNAYPGWTDIIQGDPQRSSGPGNPNGADYRWGYLYGENFDRCAWIDNGAVDGTPKKITNDCGTPRQTFTDGIHNELAGDGSVTNMHYAGSGCTDHNGYGNVAPWRVPATPANSRGVVADGHELRWRYVSRDGKWVLVRDPSAPAGTPNWYFVHRGCVSVANVN
jgi:hypothetical protein